MFSLFGKPTQPQGTNTPQAPQQQEQQPNQQQPNSQQPNSQTTNQPNTPTNPLDAYSKIFEPQQNAPETPPAFNLDPKVLGEVSGSLDFTKSVQPELLQKALTGDAQSLLQIMNQIGQQAYQSALSHSSSLTDKFVGARSAFDQKQLGTGVKRELTTQALSNIPNYNHPVVKNQLNMLANQIQAANPEYSPEQIAQTAAKMMQDLAGAINPQSTEAKDEPKQVDWASYLTKQA